MSTRLTIAYDGSSSACCTTSVPTLIIQREAAVAAGAVVEGTVTIAARASENRVPTARTAVAALADPS